jgi:hypothetical protein
MRTVRWGVSGLALMTAVALGLAGAAVLRGGTIPAARAAMKDTSAEVQTALTHAGFAQKYDTLKEVTLHLHHVLNCLVGPKDSMFDTAAGDPCQGQGNGILPDIQSGMGKDAQYYEAAWAARIADDAIKSGDLQQAKSGAHVITLILTDVQQMK